MGGRAVTHSCTSGQMWEGPCQVQPGEAWRSSRCLPPPGGCQAFPGRSLLENPSPTTREQESLLEGVLKRNPHFLLLPPQSCKAPLLWGVVHGLRPAEDTGE